MTSNQVVLSLFEPAEPGYGRSDASTGSNVVALGPNARKKDFDGGPGGSRGNGSGGTRSGGGSHQTLLGQLLWWSVSDAVRLTPTELTSALDKASMDPRILMPQAPSAASALTRAAEAAAVTHRPVNHDRSGDVVENENYANVLFRSATRGVKQMVTEILDSSEGRLSYEPLARVKLEDGNLRVRRIGEGALLEAEADSIAHLRTYYALEKGRHDGEAVRRILGKVLGAARAIPLRNSGGMYFVPRETGGEAQKILSFVDEVRETATDAPGRTARPSRAMSVPLVDTVEYRAVVADSLEEHVQKEATGLIGEMSRLLKSDHAVTRKRQRGFVERGEEAQGERRLLRGATGDKGYGGAGEPGGRHERSPGTVGQEPRRLSASAHSPPNAHHRTATTGRPPRRSGTL